MFLHFIEILFIIISFPCVYMVYSLAYEHYKSRKNEK